MYLYLVSFVTESHFNSSRLKAAASLFHSVVEPCQETLQLFGAGLNYMTLARRKALNLSFMPCARYARSHLTCYFKVIFRAWKHIETAPLPRVRGKGGQGKVRKNGKRLSVLPTMHWKSFELQKQSAATISSMKQTRLCKTQWIFSNADMALRR